MVAGAGFEPATSGLMSALHNTHCQMSIIGHTFNPQEQDNLLDRVQEGNPSVFVVLCLRFELTQPRSLFGRRRELLRYTALSAPEFAS
jgi:hypothetical protein